MAPSVGPAVSKHGRSGARALLPPALVAATILLGATTCSGGAGVGEGPVAVGAQTPRSSAGLPSARTVSVALARSVPVRVRIASIGLDTALMDLGLQKDGSLEVPPTGFPAGWYVGGPTPGELGPAVIAGHVDWQGPAVFHRLHDARPGDLVTVTRADGSTPTFRITRLSQFPKDAFPSDLVYGNLDHPALRLITCGGVLNTTTGHYEDNIVVFADLVRDRR